MIFATDTRASRPRLRLRSCCAQRHDAQIHAAQALANLATENREGQAVIAKAGAIPLLIAMLASGRAQEAASHALGRLAFENLPNQLEIVKLGGIPRLLTPLSTRSGVNTDAQVQAAAAIAAIAGGERSKDRQNAVVKAGGLRPILALLGSRYHSAQCMALHALANVAMDNLSNQDEIARLEGLPPLISLLSSGSSAPDVQMYAARALAALVKHNSHNQSIVTDIGAIPLLVSLLRATNVPSVEAAATGALWALSVGNATNQGSVASAGAVSLLVSMLGSRSGEAANLAGNALSSIGLDNPAGLREISKMLVELMITARRESTQERAAATLWRLVRQNLSQQLEIAKAGGAQPLVRLLRDGPPGGRSFALWSLSLCIDDSNRAMVVESGAIQPLVDDLSSSDIAVAEQAAGALNKLANRHTIEMIANAGAVSPLVALLDRSGECAEIRQHAAGALSALAMIPSLRVAIERAGGISPLVALLTDPLSSESSKSSTALALGLLSHESDDEEAIPANEEMKEDEDKLPKQLGRISRKTLIAQEGAIGPLVRLLSEDGKELQETAAGALKALADQAPIRSTITESGAIGPLVALLGGSNPKAREHAEGVLVRLSLEMTNRVLIIQQLVAMLFKAEMAAREQAAAAIANLARESSANCSSIVDAGGIQPLLALLETESAKAKESSASAIAQLARGSRSTQDAITQAGGIPLLVAVLASSSSSKGDVSSQPLDANVTYAIWMLAKENTANQLALAEAGVISPLVSRLSNASRKLQLPATGVLECLVQIRDLQAPIVQKGAIAPLCMLSRDGELETQEQAAAVLWSLAKQLPTSEKQAEQTKSVVANRTTIAKLGGIDSLVKMLASGGSEKSHINAAGALSAIAIKHSENRGTIARRIVSQLNGKLAPNVASRILAGISTMCGHKCSDGRLVDEHRANQLAMSKVGAVTVVITWLGHEDDKVQTEATRALLAIAINNYTTQVQIAKVEGLRGLIAIINHGCVEAQEFAAQALWHLASDKTIQKRIAGEKGVAALVCMLQDSGERGAELAALALVRLAQGNPAVSVTVADAGGILPLVNLLGLGGEAAKQAAAAIAELSLVAINRVAITSAGGIPPLIQLLSSRVIGTPETAARALAHLARSDEAPDADADEDSLHNADERREIIRSQGGVKLLIMMLDGSNLTGDHSNLSTGALWGRAKDVVEDTIHRVNLPGGSDPTFSSIKMGMQEQAAATLSDFASVDTGMQDEIIEHGGVPRLLALVHEGSSVPGQEHAAAALWHLSTSALNQMVLINNGCVPELLTLVRSGSPKVQEIAAGALSNIARASCVGASSAGLSAITEGNGILAFVALMSNMLATPLSKEYAAAALLHLATDPESRDLIAHSGGIAPLVALLKDGTDMAHRHASDALARLANQGRDHQSEIAKKLTSLLMKNSTTVQHRAAHALKMLAVDNPGSSVIIVKAGVISPMIRLVSNAHDADVGQEAADVLETLVDVDGTAKNEAAVADLVLLLGTGSLKAQELVAQLLLSLCAGEENKKAAAKAGAVKKLIALLSSRSLRVQTLSLSILSALSSDSQANSTEIAQHGGVKKMINLLSSSNVGSRMGAAAIIADLARESEATHADIVNKGGIGALVNLLSGSSDAEAKAEAAGAVGSLCKGHTVVTRLALEAGALEPIVKLLEDQSECAERKGAGALAMMMLEDECQYQEAVARAGGIPLLVKLLEDPSRPEVLAHAATALSKLMDGNTLMQTAVARAGGIPLLVTSLQDSSANMVVVAAASALRNITAKHANNRAAFAAAGGILPLVRKLATEGLEMQTEMTSTLCNLTSKNPDNLATIATLLVKLLGDKSVPDGPERAARAIAQLGRGGISARDAIARAGAPVLLVKHLEDGSQQLGAEPDENTLNSIERLQREIAVAIRSLAAGCPAIQQGIARCGGIPLLIAMLKPPVQSASRKPAEITSFKQLMNKVPSPKPSRSARGAGGSAEARTNLQRMMRGAATGGKLTTVTQQEDIQREAAGALWTLSSDSEIIQLIADSGGISHLIELLTTGSKGTQATAAGVLCTMCASRTACIMVSDAKPIPALEAVLETGLKEAKEQASGALRLLARDGPGNEESIGRAVVRILSKGAVKELECAIHLTHDLSLIKRSRNAMVEAGVIPYLVKQVEEGTNTASDHAVHALRQIAQVSADHRSEVTHTLFSARPGAVPPSLRAGRALSEINSEADLSSEGGQATGMFSPMFSSQHSGRTSASTSTRARSTTSG